MVEPSGQIRQKSFEMTIPQFQVCIYWCEWSICCGRNWRLRFFSVFILFSAELPQTVQRGGSCYGDCMMAARTPECFPQLCPSLPVTTGGTAWARCSSVSCLRMWIRITANVICQFCTPVFLFFKNLLQLLRWLKMPLVTLSAKLFSVCLHLTYPDILNLHVWTCSMLGWTINLIIITIVILVSAIHKLQELQIFCQIPANITALWFSPFNVVHIVLPY